MGLGGDSEGDLGPDINGDGSVGLGGDLEGDLEERDIGACLELRRP